MGPFPAIPQPASYPEARAPIKSETDIRMVTASPGDTRGQQPQQPPSASSVSDCTLLPSEEGAGSSLPQGGSTGDNRVGLVNMVGAGTGGIRGHRVRLHACRPLAAGIAEQGSSGRPAERARQLLAPDSLAVVPQRLAIIKTAHEGQGQRHDSQAPQQDVAAVRSVPLVAQPHEERQAEQRAAAGGQHRHDVFECVSLAAHARAQAGRC